MIYFDNAATTRLRPEALAAMLPYLKEEYGNPSGAYAISRRAHFALDRAREQVKEALGAEFDREIFFTSGGTESDNWALKGAAFANRAKGNHIITTKTEHHAVLEACAWMEKQGFSVTYLPVGGDCRVDPAALSAALRPETILISVMWANNEVGAVNDIETIGAIAKSAGVLFHTDAVQAAGHLPIDVEKCSIDLLSLSAHKFHGPKGVGVLYARNGVQIDNLISGGAQERQKRSGTENVAGVAGLGEALALAVAELEEDTAHILEIREYARKRISSEIPSAILNGSALHRLPGNLNFSFLGTRSETTLYNLDFAGIACSGGAACTAGALGKSHVLLAMGLSEERMASAVRFSFSKYNTLEEIDILLSELKKFVHEK